MDTIKATLQNNRVKWRGSKPMSYWLENNILKKFGKNLLKN